MFPLLQSCQADLVKDNGHKYFLSVLADAYMPVSTKYGQGCTLAVCGCHRHLTFVVG